MNCEFPEIFKLVLEKAEEPEVKLPTSVGASKKQESSRKTSISALLKMPKPLIVWITINWKFINSEIYKFLKLINSERDGNTRPPDLTPEKSLWRSGSKLELDMEQQTGSK